jgi:hypothetical protein
MEDIYYFSQGRLIHNVTYKKFVDTKSVNVSVKDLMEIDNIKDMKEPTNKCKSILNFKVFNASMLRYK